MAMKGIEERSCKSAPVTGIRMLRMVRQRVVRMIPMAKTRFGRMVMRDLTLSQNHE